jgi:hypothetical protein
MQKVMALKHAEHNTEHMVRLRVDLEKAVQGCKVMSNKEQAKGNTLINESKSSSECGLKVRCFLRARPRPMNSLSDTAGGNPGGTPSSMWPDPLGAGPVRNSCSLPLDPSSSKAQEHLARSKARDKGSASLAGIEEA